MPEVVLDASAMVDLLLANEVGAAVRRRITGCALHAPAHMPGEVLSALGRLHRAGDLSSEEVETMLRRLTAAPITYRSVAELLLGSWARRDRLRLVDAVYVELADSLGLDLVTTDRRLRDAPSVEVVHPD